MPESQNGTSTVTTKKKEISMELRLLLAFLLMGAVLFLTPYFYKPQAPVNTPQKAAETTAQAEAAPAKPAEAAPATTASPPVVPGQISADKEETYVVETDVYKVVFSNRGGVVRSWVLKHYKDGKDGLVDLVHPSGSDKAGYPFSLVFPNQKPGVDLDKALYAAKISEDGRKIEFEFSDGHVSARKTFEFQPNRYLARVESTVTQNGAPVPHLLAWRGGFGDPTVVKSASLQRTLHFDPAENELIVKEAKAAKDGPISASGRFAFAGLEDAYFAAVFLPFNGGSFSMQTFGDAIASAPDAKPEPHIGAAVGGDGTNQFNVFVGPKDIGILRSVDPKLEQVVDFGWFAVLAKPLFLVLSWVNHTITHNYGWAIVLVTVAINFLLLPLKLSSLKSMKKMQVLQPQIAAINEKYKGISIRDPRKAQQNQEIMELYRRNSVNPAGGCLPMLLQIPFFIAFYKVLTVAIEMRGASWLWVTDLSQPETLPIRILPLAMIATQFILQKMSPSTGMDPAQQRVMLLMPLMLGFMFYGVSSGLVLYWLTGNLVGIVQQWFFNRTVNVTVTEPKPGKQQKKRSRN